MKILIVGGTGVISYEVVNEALERGFEVTCINRGKSKTQKLPSNVDVFICDYRDEKKLRSFLEDKYYDTVIDVLCYTENDIDYSVSLFKDKCSQYIFFSSCAVYNKGKGDYECTEDSELINHVWKYSVDKVACENKLISLSNEHKFNYTIVRPAVTYGNTRIPYGISPKYNYHGTLIQRLLNGKPIILWDGGTAYSTITRVEDFAKGLIGLLGNTKAYNQAVHIVGDERHQWKDVINELANILNVVPQYADLSKEAYAKELPYRAGEILGGRGISQLLNNKKLKNLVPGFKTTIPLKEGLRKTVEYYMQNNYLLGIDWQFEGETDYIIRKHFKGSELAKVHFIDYLGNASLKDKITYYFALYKDNFFVRFILFVNKTIKLVKRICRKIIRIIKL